MVTSNFLLSLAVESRDIDSLTRRAKHRQSGIIDKMRRMLAMRRGIFL